MGRRKSVDSAGAGVLILLGGIILLLGSIYRFVVEHSAEIGAVIVASAAVALVGFVISRRGSNISTHASSEAIVAKSASVKLQPVNLSAGRVVRSAKPSYQGYAKWIDSGESVSIQGTVITSGLFYFGETLSVDKGRTTDQYAINPKLPIRSPQSDIEGKSMPYWPSYAGITPAARLAFVDWMAGGRRDPAYGIGYIFLFFYGLEHRQFVDCDTSSTGTLVSEVERLLSVYGGSNSFQHYARDFVTYARIVAGVSVKEPGLSAERSGSEEMAPDTRIHLGKRLSESGVLGARDTLLWTLAMPDVYLRTAAVRCFDEFVDLWTLRFSQKYPGGFSVKATPKYIRLQYRAASGAFTVDVPGPHEQYPDILAVTTSTNPLKALVQSCTDELDIFSRFVGRKPESRSTIQAALFLPDGLRRQTLVGAIGRLSERMAVIMGENGRASTSMRKMLEIVELDYPPHGKIVPALADQLGRILDALNIAIEPDSRYGSGTPQIDDQVFVFKAPNGGPVDPERVPYRVMKAQVEVAVLAAAADGDSSHEELVRVIAAIRAGSDLSGVEQARLIAFAVNIFKSPPKQQRVLRRLAERTVAEKEAIATAATAFVGGGAKVAPNDIKFLERLHKALGLPKDRVYSELHRIEPMLDEPVPMSVEKRVAGIPIPKEIETPARAPNSVQIDAGRLERVRRETETVSALLAQIFVEESAPVPGPAVPAANEHHRPAFEGLDDAHAELVEFLEIKGEITRHEFDERARALKLLPDGAIERINDWSFDHFDEALLDDGEQVVMAADLRTRLAEMRETAA
jgi:tellurite resistance protein